MIDDPVFSFAAAEAEKFFDDFGDRVGVGFDGTGAGSAAQRAHAAGADLRGFAGEGADVGLDRDQGVAADVDFAWGGVVEGDDGYVLAFEVFPDIELGPVGEGEDAHALAGVDFWVVEVPEFWTLIFGVPLAELVAEGEDAFFGTGFFFVATSTADCGVGLEFLEAIYERAGAEEAAALGGAKGVGVGSGGDGFFVDVDNEIGFDFFDKPVSEFDQFGVFVGGVDVHEWEG